QFEGTEQPDPMSDRVRNLLETNLELTPEQVVAALKKAGLNSADLPQEVRRKIARARKEAMMLRLNHEIEAGVTDQQELLQRLCPTGVQSGVRTEAEKLLPTLYPRMMSVHDMGRFGVPLPTEVPLCYCPSEKAVNIQKFAEVSRYSGFIDLLPSSYDGTVRTIPLLVNYRG